MKAAELFLACLREAKVTTIFGNPGTTEIPLLDALTEKKDINYLITLHENVAVAMADGYARASGKVGFVNVHTAAGTANALGGLYNAFVDNSPVVVTAGYKDTRILGRECFSEVPDLLGMTRQFTKFSWSLLLADRVAEDLLRGIRTALIPPRGPVFMSFPENLLGEEIKDGKIKSTLPELPIIFEGAPQLIDKAAKLLVEAKYPLLIAGSEIARAGILEKAIELADLLGFAVVTEGRESLCSLNFPHTHPAFRGSFQASLPEVRRADVILGLGCKAFTQTSYSEEPELPPQAIFIHFHSNPHEIGKIYKAHIGVLTEVSRGTEKLIEACLPLITREVKKAIEERKEFLKNEKEHLEAKKREELASLWDKKPISVPQLVQVLNGILKPDTVIVDEAVRSSRALLRFYNFTEKDTYFRASGGVLGWGVPAALGIKLAMPERDVVAFVGDGSLLFSVQALWTAAKYRIPIKIIVCNNRQYRAVKDAALRYQGVVSRLGYCVGTDLVEPEIDFCKLAEGLGIEAVSIGEPKDLKGTLTEIINIAEKPVLVDVKIL